MNSRLNFKLFLLCLFFGLTFQTASLGNYYHPNLTFDNAGTVSSEIIDYYNYTYGGSNVVSFQLALQQLFSDLNLPTVDNSCEKGHLVRTGYAQNSNGGHNMGTTLLFRWMDDPNTTNEYYNGYLDLETLERWDTVITAPGAIYNFEGTTQWKLFVLNARCSLTAQSAYFIIIVDRDLNLNGLENQNQNGGIESQEGGTELDFRLSQQDQDLQVYPNPNAGSSAQVAFSLSKDQNVSLYLIDGSTGRVVERILADQFIREGEHVQVIATESLIDGIYHVVLETDTKRRITKMIKLGIK